ncbi:unnamed protein product [Linum trigynum]|uniref:NADH dehydrogenase [ubiquinone] 1 alpha subcomplex subunit 12 n=1 Tax=Linum trigynum TaxID=586398 RepID=A0AAV2CCH2_9ROSI
MSKFFARISGYFSNRASAGVDKAGNRYFSRIEEIDGVTKEKRWVKFKGEQDPTSVPVEWISWLNGQRKNAPTPEEMMILEARREQVKQNVALLKKEEEERKAKEGSSRKVVTSGKGSGPDLKSFMRQFPTSGEGGIVTEKEADESERLRKEDPKTDETEQEEAEGEPVPRGSEPTGSGATFRPGTWQPPT